MHHLFGWTGLCVAEIFSVDLGHLSKYSRAHLFVYVTFVGDRGTERQGLSLGIVLDGSNFASKFGHFLMFVPLDFFFWFSSSNGQCKFASSVWTHWVCVTEIFSFDSRVACCSRP